MKPKIPTDADTVRPADFALISPEDTMSPKDICDVTRLNKKTVLAAIHGGLLPAWFPGGNPQVGFRCHRRDVEAWFFADPERAHTPGVGTPEGPRGQRRTGIDQYQAEGR